MLEKEVDARGKPCPQPVICTKKALEEIEAGVVVALVDNEVARDNVLKLARSLGYRAEVQERGKDFAVRITKGQGETASQPEPVEPSPEADGGGTVILIPTNTFGKGAEELGALLVKTFLYTLTELGPKPQTLVLINSGVKLAVSGAETVSHLAALAASGVEILVCGTCLDYYGLKDRLAAGNVSNMYTITEKLLGARKVISIP